ncbi:hypothetical protein ACWCPM_33585 [Streptomyces sp. NPDC002309]
MSDGTRPMAGGEPGRSGLRDDLDTATGTAGEVPGGIGGSLRAGAVAPGGVGAREKRETHEARGAAASEVPGRSARTPAASSRTAPLLPGEETGGFEQRLQRSVASFVDGPRAAVEEADHVLEELADRFTEAVTQRRRTLRRAWESTDEATSATSDTEQLRLALRDYRELAERLLSR